MTLHLVAERSSLPDPPKTREEYLERLIEIAIEAFAGLGAPQAADSLRAGLEAARTWQR